MTGYTSDYFSDGDEDSVERFEDMLRSNASYFFDVDEIESVCDFYFDRGNHTKARKAIEHGLELHPGSNSKEPKPVCLKPSKPRLKTVKKFFWTSPLSRK
ncbi:MAG: hypothetical protein LC670_14425 [Flavobacteriales bacterium]|nr:hypothetical protein [Flavobacteriales bacterium]